MVPIKRTPGLHFATHFITTQTYKDILLSCSHVVSLIVYMRDNFPDTDCRLDLTGTDCVELFWSQMGQWVGNHRQYTYGDLYRNISSMVRLEEIRVNPEGPDFAKPHPKQESIWNKQDVYRGQNNASLRAYPDDEAVLAAWRNGRHTAQNLARSTGMAPNDNERGNGEENNDDDDDDDADDDSDNANDDCNNDNGGAGDGNNNDDNGGDDSENNDGDNNDNDDDDDMWYQRPFNTTENMFTELDNDDIFCEDNSNCDDQPYISDEETLQVDDEDRLLPHGTNEIRTILDQDFLDINDAPGSEVKSIVSPYVIIPDSNKQMYKSRTRKYHQIGYCV